jgi:Subtilase family
MRRSVAVLTFVAALALAVPSAHAQTSGGLQVFMRVDGSTPEWRALSLTVTKLQVGGLDSRRKRFFVTAFQGSRQLSIPRSASGSPRFFVSGVTPAGSIDEVLVTLGASALTTQDGGSLPITVRAKSVLLRLPRPMALKPGETGSLVADIGLGVDAVVKGNTVELRPTLSAVPLPSPDPQHFLNGAETVEGSGVRTRFSELGIEVLRTKLLDQSNGAVRDLTLRTDTGAAVSFPQLRRENETLWRSRHGSLRPGLVERLKSLARTDVVTADLHLATPGPQTFVTDVQTPQAWVQAHQQFVANRQAAAEPVVSDIVADLEAAGATIVASSADPPRLRIQASRDVLEAVAARLHGVLEVNAAPTDNAILGTLGAADLVQSALPQWLFTPESPDPIVRIAIHDVRPCIMTDHEMFSSVSGFGLVIEPPPYDCDPSVGPTQDLASAGHSTRVAGALAGMVPDGGKQPPDDGRPPPGLVGLPQSYIIQTNNCDNPDVEKSPHIVSVSCIPSGGVQVPSDIPHRAFDEAVFAHRIFVANGAGNIGSGPLRGAHDETAFCYSYNAVCVGGYNNNDTVGPANFGDDVPAGGWKNFEGREKPDLIGPYGACLPDATPQAFGYEHIGWNCSGGTSFATPAVAGTAALLMANFPAALTGDPTLTRAVLMASASHALPGYRRVPSYSDDDDDRGGAGAPRVDRAKVIVENNRFYSALVDRETDFDAEGYLRRPLTFQVNENDRVRVVLTYDQCQTSAVSANDVLDPDLDLTAVENSLNPTLFVHANNSHLDNTEIVEFDVPRGATVNLFLRAQSWTPCTDGSLRTYVAVAWDSYNIGPPPAGG